MKKIKIRKSVRILYIIIFLAIITISIYYLYNAFNLNNKNNFKKENIYEYNNKYLYSCDINMIENKYITTENESKSKVYITDLIDNANINMTYTYNANQESALTYNYQIVGKLEAVYSVDGEEQKVLEKTDILVPMKELNANSNKIEINENLKLDLKEKIQMIKQFQRELGMQVKTKYTVLLEIVTKTSILNQEVLNVYSPDIVFEIGAKTTSVGTSIENSEKPQVITKMVPENNNSSQINTGVASITILVSSVLLIIVLIKTENNNIVRNEYKLELNKILKECEEKIVEINSKIETEGQGIVDVKEFNEIIKVSEELFKPILYWNNEQEEESWFCVIGNNIVYRFILKR